MRRFVVYLIVVLVALLATIPAQAHEGEHEEEPDIGLMMTSCEAQLGVIGEVFEEFRWWEYIEITVIVDTNSPEHEAFHSGMAFSPFLRMGGGIKGRDTVRSSIETGNGCHGTISRMIPRCVSFPGQHGCRTIKVRWVHHAHCQSGSPCRFDANGNNTCDS